MLEELWNNKSVIIRNYISILRNNIIGIITVTIILCLLVIYAYLRYQSFKPSAKLLHPEIETFTDTEPNNIIQQHPVTSKYQFIFINPGSTESKALYTSCYQHYLSGFNQPNIQARGFDTKAELERTYKTLIIPITPAEQTHISSTLGSILSQIQDTKLAKVTSWISQASIAKGAKWLESGMPHTHSNTMIMNAGWISKPTCSTYFHELFHIIQRNNPAIFENLYTQSWNFKKVAGGTKSILGLDTQISMARMNPDANDFCWIWLDNINGKYYWINAIFTQSAPTSLLAVQYLAYPLIQQQDGQTYRYLGSQPIELKALSAFVNRFGIGYNHYHPNEIASQYAEYYFVADSSQIPPEIKNKPAYHAFINWLDNVTNL